jgi:hypothetical protein
MFFQHLTSIHYIKRVIEVNVKVLSANIKKPTYCFNCMQLNSTIVCLYPKLKNLRYILVTTSSARALKTFNKKFVVNSECLDTNSHRLQWSLKPTLGFTSC